MADPKPVAAEVVAIARPLGGSDVGELFKLAIDKGLSVEGLEKLVTLHERIADRQARQEFADAVSAFQSACPPIKKSSKVDFASRSGVRVAYTFADLDTIVSTVRAELAKNGLSFSWDSETSDTAMKCVCTLRHTNGHRESSSFSCPLEAKAGMGSQQAAGAALTYAKRQSLVQVLGLTTTDSDTDGDAGVHEYITESQAADVHALIDEVKADEGRFLAYMKVGSVEEIPAGRLKEAVDSLRRKARR